MLSVVKHLANVSRKVPARDPSALRFVGMTTDVRSESRDKLALSMPSKEEENSALLIAVQFVFLDNCYIISFMFNDFNANPHK